MKRVYRIAVRIFAIFGMIVFCVITPFIVAVTWKIPFHNYQLWNMQRNFRSSMQSVHPAGSRLLAEMAEFGNFGESNHCDYLVGEFRSSPLSKEEVLKNYAAVATSTFIGERSAEIGVYFIDGEFFKKDYLWSEWIEKYLPNNHGITNENIYVIYSEDAMNPPDGDIRCN